MSLTTLPMEVLEILLLYFGSSDLINVLDVLRVEGSRAFWKDVCKRNGFKGDEKCWKIVFQRNINWFSNKFRKREYIFNKTKEALLTPSSSSLSSYLGIRGVLHGNKILLKSNNAQSVQVWNIESSPKIEQTFDTQNIKVGGSKLVTQNSTETCIYENQQKSYCKLKTISNISLNFHSDISITDNYFAGFLNDLLSIKVINLNSLEEFNIGVSTTKLGPVSKLVVSKNVLNILLNEGSKYLLKRFDLLKQTWLKELILFQGAALISIPEIKLSSKLITSWSSFLDYKGMTPLKIWSTNGEFLKSLSMDSIRSFRKHAFIDRSLLWIVLEGDYIIFSQSETCLSIWTSQNPDVCKDLEMERLSNSQTVISSSFLILSYSHCFKVIDYKKSVYLYEVRFDNHNFEMEPLNLRSFSHVNDYFYVVLTERTGVKGGTTNNQEQTTSQEYLNINQEDYCCLSIYDYRG